MIVSIRKDSFGKKIKSAYYHRGRNGFYYPHELAWLP